MTGELISLFVAFSWTATALFAEVGSRRMGSLPFNAVRMTMSTVLLAFTLWLVMGAPYPRFANGAAWGWLLLSGLVGYVIGDYCLMQGYIHIGARFGQLFMTLSAPAAAITARLLIGERMHPTAVLGMAVTLGGIAMSVLAREDGDGRSRGVRLKLPAKGVFYAAMAGVGQGVGLVLSKTGLLHYEESVMAASLSLQYAPQGVLVPLPLKYSIPFAATLIRSYIGIAGFYISLALFGRQGLRQLGSAVRDRKAMWCALWSTLFGPFIGVSASLLATLYTNAGVAQTIFALTPVLIIAPSALLFHQKVTVREVVGAVISVVGVSLFFL